MKIHYRDKGKEIEIVRCYGADGKVRIPPYIEGKPVTVAAPYAFSARKDREEEDILIWESEDARLFREQERLLAGEAVESVEFPDSMETIGKYIFYGCRSLKTLRFSDCLTNIGSGAFTGCGALSRLKVFLVKGERSCVSEILGDLWQRIDVAFYGDGDEKNREETKKIRKRAELVFPAHYEEAVENTPARILFTRHHGSGNNYRQCFFEKRMDYRKYDELFAVAKVQDEISVLADLVLGRLMYPEGLGKTAEKEYVQYIREHASKITGYLTDKEDLPALREISQRNLWDRESLDAAVEYAARTGQTGILSFLMNEKREKFPDGLKRQRYIL